jgi:hypothetical protein
VITLSVLRRVNVNGTARSFEEAYEELKKRDEEKNT